MGTSYSLRIVSSQQAYYPKMISSSVFREAAAPKVRAARRAGICYFLRVFAASDRTSPFRLGAAAITFCFSFFGFFASRFPRCSLLAMVQSSDPAWALSLTLARTGASVAVPIRYRRAYPGTPLAHRSILLTRQSGQNLSHPPIAARC